MNTIISNTAFRKHLSKMAYYTYAYTCKHTIQRILVSDIEYIYIHISYAIYIYMYCIYVCIT